MKLLLPAAAVPFMHRVKGCSSRTGTGMLTHPFPVTAVHVLDILRAFPVIKKMIGVMMLITDQERGCRVPSDRMSM